MTAATTLEVLLLKNTAGSLRVPTAYGRDRVAPSERAPRRRGQAERNDRETFLYAYVCSVQDRFPKSGFVGHADHAPEITADDVAHGGRS